MINDEPPGYGNVVLEKENVIVSLALVKRLFASLSLVRVSLAKRFLPPAQAAYQGLCSSPRAGSRRLRASLASRRGSTTALLLDLLRQGLTHPGLPLFLVPLAALAGLPSLWYGLAVDDDLLQRQILLTSGLVKSAASLFVFLDPRTNLAQMDLGSLPWWTLPGARVAFFRPLAAISLWLDYRLWPGSPVLMHVHSLVWYCALCCLVGLFFRRILGNTASAGLAALLFTVNVTHFSSLVALNTRNVLQSALFGLLALLLHDRWRRESWRPGAWAGPLCLALSLLSAEVGLAIVAYLAAYAVCVETGPWRERLKSLAPYVLVCLIWRAGYGALGYGVYGSDFYIDPSSEPRLFANAILERWPVLLFGQWVMPDPGVHMVLSAWARLVYWAVAVLFVGQMTACLLPLLRHNRAARFLALGMVLSAIPACAVLPATGRHVMFIGIGATGLLALLIAGLAGRHDWAPGKLSWRIPAWGMGAFLLVLQAVVYPIAVPATPRVLGGKLYTSMMDLGTLPNPAGKDVVVVTAPAPGQSIYMLGLRKVLGRPSPARLRVLAPGYAPVAVTRLDTNTLLIHPEYGFLLEPGTRVGSLRDSLPVFHYSYATQVGDVFFRGQSAPMPVGQKVNLAGMEAEVIELTRDGRPLVVRFRFDRPLEDLSLLWLRWNWAMSGYQPFIPPAPGETVQLPGPF